MDRYRCTKGHTIQTLGGPVLECPVCRAPVQKLTRLGGAGEQPATQLVDTE